MIFTETEDDKSKTTEGQGDTTVGDSADIDPTTRMIIDAYDPVMVTCHQDSYIRFWDPFDVSNSPQFYMTHLDLLLNEQRYIF